MVEECYGDDVTLLSHPIILPLLSQMIVTMLEKLLLAKLLMWYDIYCL